MSRSKQSAFVRVQLLTGEECCCLLVLFLSRTYKTMMHSSPTGCCIIIISHVKQKQRLAQSSFYTISQTTVNVMGNGLIFASSH